MNETDLMWHKRIGTGMAAGIQVTLEALGIADQVTEEHLIALSIAAGHKYLQMEEELLQDAELDSIARLLFGS